MTRLLGLLLCLCVCACGPSDRTIQLGYVPAAPPPPGPEPARARIAAVTATDSRGETDATWVGAIRNDMGQPAKNLHTPQPVAQAVSDAFRRALAARGLLAPQGEGQGETPVRLQAVIDVKRLECDLYGSRHADIDLVLTLSPAGGPPVYRDEIVKDVRNGQIYTAGRIASFTIGLLLPLPDASLYAGPEEMQSLAEATLTQAIDESLDKPAFLAALTPARP